MSNRSTPDASRGLAQRVGAPYFFTAEHYERLRVLESDGWWNAAMRDVTEMLLRQARLPGRGAMLVVGCSSGHMMVWFAKLYPEWRVAGLDGSPERLRAARLLNLDVSRGSPLALPYPDQCADLVKASDATRERRHRSERSTHQMTCGPNSNGADSRFFVSVGSTRRRKLQAVAAHPSWQVVTGFGCSSAGGSNWKGR